MDRYHFMRPVEGGEEPFVVEDTHLGIMFEVPGSRFRASPTETLLAREILRLADGIDTAIDQLQTRDVAPGVVLFLRRLRGNQEG